jgi:hypothetical protein
MVVVDVGAKWESSIVTAGVVVHFCVVLLKWPLLMVAAGGNEDVACPDMVSIFFGICFGTGKEFGRISWYE